MHPIFSITVEQVQSLTDEQARELIARLCREELRNNSISEAAASWGGDQRAKDGGVDVRVSIDPPCGFVGYIRRDETAFQVKAEKFGPARISEEMAPDGILRPAINELATTNGSYIIVSTQDSVSDSARTKRIEAMEACLSTHGLKGKLDVDFYDCRKVADWIEKFPAIANWVRSKIGQPLSGWRPYGPWAYMESDASGEYLLDERVRMFAPDEDHGSDTLTAINNLRSKLSKSVSIRIVGLSGVGKTRLVQALFDPRIVTPLPAINQENVIYTDLADNPTPQPIAMIDALLAEHADPIVVIDNCSAEVHKRLTELIEAPNCKLRLITIEYDIRDDLPEGTLCFRLEGVSRDVLLRLLRGRYPILSKNDLDKIAEFSDGNARVAYALAATAQVTGELANLQDEDLFKRLFHQRNAENDNLLHHAEVASLLYSFNADPDAPEPELPILAGLADTPIASFTRSVAELERRGLAQARGPWRAILPHAIANRLANRAVASFSRKALTKTLIDESSARITRSFSRRLGYLHQSEKAQQLACEWLRPDGRYGDIRALDAEELQIFKNIAPIELEATLSALERATNNPSFTSTANLHRTDFANVARSIAYDPRFFDRAVEVLVRFAVADEERAYNRTASLLETLFQCFLSGTEARSEQKASIIRSLISTGDQARISLAHRLLEMGLKASNFSAHSNFDFGARKRSYGWSPRNDQEIRETFSPFIAVAIEFGKSESDDGRTIRGILGKAVADLWVHAKTEDEIENAAAQFQPIDTWPEAWHAARRALSYNQDQLSASSLEKLKSFEKAIAPRDLRSKIAARILTSSDYDDEMEIPGDGEPESSDSSRSFENRYKAAQESARSLGVAAGANLELVFEMLPELLHGNRSERTISFGAGLAARPENRKRILTEARQAIADTSIGDVNLFLLRGFIQSWQGQSPQEVNDFLDEAYKDNVWKQWMVELEVRRPLDSDSFRRLLSSLENDGTPVWQYQYLAMGRSTDPLSVQQVQQLVERIAAKKGGLPIATNIISMVIYCAKERDGLYRSELSEACLNFLEKLNWLEVLDRNWDNDPSLNKILEFALASEGGAKKKASLLDRIASAGREKPYHSGRFLVPFARHLPGATLDAIFVPDSTGSFEAAIRIASTYEEDGRASALFNVSADELLKWCEVSPAERYPFAAEACRLFVEKDGKLSITDCAKMLVERAPDKEKILRIFVNRFTPSSYSGLLSDNLRTRLPLFDQLNPTNDNVMQTIVDGLRKEFEVQLAAVQKWDEDRERKQTGSFE